MNQTSKSRLTPIDAAIDALLQNLPVIEETETVALLSANGRILAEDCVAEINVPSQANSAMDGYAIRVEDLEGETGTLAVSQRIAAGELGVQLNSGEAARIFTGAPIPPGANAVVMQENCSLSGEQLTILQKVSRGENLRQAGEDVAAGSRLFQAGHRLRPQDVGLLAAIGKSRVEVKRQLRVALMTTGDELVQPGTELKAGQIYNSNYYTLCAMLNALNAEVLDFGIIGDDFNSTRTALREAAAAADCIISTGGVSVGEEDHVKAAVEAEGSLQIWKLAIKPGKPLACGIVEGIPFFGLPGNPVSAGVTSAIFLKAAMAVMLGMEDQGSATALLGRDLEANDFRQDYLRATLSTDPDGNLVATPFERQDSSMMARLANADCLLIRPPDAPAISAGERVEIIPLGSGMVAF